MRGFALILAFLLGCGGSDDDPVSDVAPVEDASGGETTEVEVPGPSTPATLQCPDEVGFGVVAADWAAGFEAAASGDFGVDFPRDKSEAHDVLGTPGGPTGTTDLENEEPLSTGETLRGRRAGTVSDSGLTSTPLPGEYVSAWRQVDGAWSPLGRALTDDNGEYALEVAEPAGEGHTTAVAVLEASGGCTTHHTWLYPAGNKVVLTDIDATLTASDEELILEITDSSYVPKEMTGARAMTTAWAEKGYLVVYITARPHVMRPETRRWLEQQGFPQGPLITANGVVFGDAAAAYKQAWVERILDELAWTVVAAYGNADSDIAAFSIGPLAGYEGTTAIDGEDYTAHIAAFVDPQPDA